MRAALGMLVPAIGFCSLAYAGPGSLASAHTALQGLMVGHTYSSPMPCTGPRCPELAPPPASSPNVNRYRVELIINYGGTWLRMMSGFRSEAEARLLLQGLHADLAGKPHRLTIMQACQTETLDNDGSEHVPPGAAGPDLPRCNTGRSVIDGASSILDMQTVPRVAVDFVTV